MRRTRPNLRRPSLAIGFVGLIAGLLGGGCGVIDGIAEPAKAAAAPGNLCELVSKATFARLVPNYVTQHDEKQSDGDNLASCSLYPESGSGAKSMTILRITLRRHDGSRDETPRERARTFYDAQIDSPLITDKPQDLGAVDGLGDSSHATYKLVKDSNTEITEVQVLKDADNVDVSYHRMPPSSNPPSPDQGLAAVTEVARQVLAKL